MSDKTLHEQLIEELMDNKVNLSPREHAARNEIIALREQLAKFDTPLKAKPAESADLDTGTSVLTPSTPTKPSHKQWQAK
jgi:hypothetical protein